MKKDLNYYLGLPYTTKLLVEEENSVFAEITELHGCMTVGNSKEDALEMIEDAKEAWLEAAVEKGMNIPEPTHNRKVASIIVEYHPRCMGQYTLHFETNSEDRCNWASLVQDEAAA